MNTPLPSRKTPPAAPYRVLVPLVCLLCLLILAACNIPAAPTAQPPIPKMSPPLIAQLSGEQVGPDEVLITASVWSWGLEAWPTITLTLPAGVTALDNTPLQWQVSLAEGQYFTQTVRAHVEDLSAPVTLTLDYHATYRIPGETALSPNIVYGGDWLYLRQTAASAFEFADNLYFGVLPTEEPMVYVTITPGPAPTLDPYMTYVPGDKNILILTYVAQATRLAATVTP